MIKFCMCVCLCVRLLWFEYKMLPKNHVLTTFPVCSANEKWLDHENIHLTKQ